MKGKSVAIVVGHAGSYDEAHSWTCAVYADPVLANQHANAAAAWAHRWYEKHRDDYSKWADDDDYVLPEPQSPFDDCLSRSDADDVTYGIRSVPFYEAVPKGSRLTCRRIVQPESD